MKHASKDLLEALAFTAAVFVYIWVLRFRAPWTILLLVAWVAAALLSHRATLESSGLSPRRFLEALVDWRYLWLTALLALALILQQRLADPQMLARGGAYFAWCSLQQFVYQNLVHRRIRASFHPGPRAWWLSGLIFGLVHWPNPVLVPATALWGALSSYLFERWPSVLALALLQLLLSSLLYELTPWQWHHGFRVGPKFYFP